MTQPVPDHQVTQHNPESAPPERAFHVEEAVAAFIMAVLCLITFANVLTRYFTNISFAFTEEISIFLLVALTLVGAATAFARGHHLSINFVVDRLSLRQQVWLQRFAMACGIVMFGILCWYGALMCLDDYETELTSPGMGLPQWWYSLCIPVLSLLIVLRLCQRLLASWRGRSEEDAA